MTNCPHFIDIFKKGCWYDGREFWGFSLWWLLFQCGLCFAILLVKAVSKADIWQPVWAKGGIFSERPNFCSSLTMLKQCQESCICYASLVLKKIFIFICLFKTVLVPNEDVLSSLSLSCCIFLSFISTFCLRSFMVSFCSSSSDSSCLISHVTDKKSSGDIPEKNKKEV